MGLSLVPMGVINLFIIINVFKKILYLDGDMHMYEAIAGYGLGGLESTDSRLEAWLIVDGIEGCHFGRQALCSGLGRHCCTSLGE